MNTPIEPHTNTKLNLMMRNALRVRRKKDYGRRRHVEIVDRIVKF